MRTFRAHLNGRDITRKFEQRRGTKLKLRALIGPENGEDVAYSLTMDESRRLYHSGVYTEAVGGSNIWIAQFNKNLDLLTSITVNGDADGYDTGLGVVKGSGQNLYVSGAIYETVGGFNIWVAQYQIPD
ncbi:hypothetical protein ACFLT2_04875 [Acidobacteriota bacterium]